MTNKPLFAEKIMASFHETKVKVPISLTKLIKLRLGDTFRFYVYHIERHISQAQRVLASAETGGQIPAPSAQTAVH